MARVIPLGTIFRRHNGDVDIYIGSYTQDGLFHHCFTKAVNGKYVTPHTSEVIWRHEYSARYQSNEYWSAFPQIEDK